MIEQDMADIDALIIHDMHTNTDYLRQIATYLVERQEPPLHLKILLLSLKMINHQGQSHIQLGVILEYIFAAANLHDDKMGQQISCQDEVLSQGLKGMYSRVLVGDFFYSRAFSLMANRGDMTVVSHLSSAINKYVEGQSVQIFQAGDPETSEQMHYQRLKKKSFLYYNCITTLVSELGHCSQIDSQALTDYGFHLGIAVQIIEETLCCIRASKSDQHKQANLPFIIIRGLHQACPALRLLIQQGVSKQSLDSAVVAQLCIQTDAITYTHTKIETEIKLAIDALFVLHESIYRLALQNLATDLLVQFDQNLTDLGY
ncbi:MAG: octaprenyl-diphosphate synthase [Gammaproteobacteria bacterium]|jgi:octaprenyl-diphosphate synthase